MLIWWALGLVVAVSGAAFLTWGWPLSSSSQDAWQLILGSMSAFVLSVYFSQRMADLDRDGSGPLGILLNTLLIYGLLALLLLFSRAYYSRTFILVMLVVTLVWILGVRLSQRLTRASKSFSIIYKAPSLAFPDQAA